MTEKKKQLSYLVYLMNVLILVFLFMFILLPNFCLSHTYAVGLLLLRRLRRAVAYRV